MPTAIFGVLAPDLSIAVEPGLTAEAAALALTGRGGIDAMVLRNAELVVVPLDSGDYRLAYTAVVGSAEAVDRIFVDAQTGVELWRYSEIETQAAVGTGRGVLGDNKKVSVSQQGATFVADDSLRPPTLLTFDMQGNLARYKLVELGASLFSSDVASDTDNVWTDPAVVDAHAHVGLTYDYYFKRFGRRGFDDRDAPIYVTTNVVSQQGALSLPPADFDYAINASWCGACGPGRVGLLFLGNGIPSNFTVGGQSITYLAGALDIVAHELTHAVTDASSRLIYANEAGALNESFSDVMAKGVEFYYHPAGSGVGQADYVVGKDVFRAARAGGANGIRSMATPGTHGDPDHYRNRYVGPDDGGGVHRNSAIPNHAFYLAIEGGMNRTSGLNVRGVGAANREQIEKVFYRAFTLLMPANATFATARAATTQAARDLYGSGGAVEQAVDSAWNAVGVPNSNSLGTYTGSVTAGSSHISAFLMNSTGSYGVNLRGNDPSVDLDLFLTPNTFGCSRLPLPRSCVLTISESPEAVESLSWPVRSGESYIIWVVNLGRRTSSFTVEHQIGPTRTASLIPSKMFISGTKNGVATAKNESASKTPTALRTVFDDGFQGKMFGGIGRGQR